MISGPMSKIFRSPAGKRIGNCLKFRIIDIITALLAENISIHQFHTKIPIIYFIEGRSPPRQMEVLHLAGALMEHSLEGIAPLRHWYINPNEKSNKYKSSLLS